MMKKFNETKKMVKQATAGMEQQASRKGKKGKKGKRRRGLGIPDVYKRQGQENAYRPPRARP